MFGGIATVWILFSDAVVNMLPQPVALQLQTVKGLIFVLVTSGTLYLLVKRYSDRVDAVLERALASETALADLLTTAPVGVVRLDSRNVVRFINPEGVRLLGLASDEILGSDLCKRLEGRPSADDLCTWLASDHDDKVLVAGDADNGRRALMARATRVADPGGDSGIIVAFSDVTASHVSAERFERLVGLHEYLAEAVEAMMVATDVHGLLSSQVVLAVEKGGFTAAAGFSLDVSGSSLQTFVEAPETATQRRPEASPVLWTARLPGPGEHRLVVYNDIGADVLNPLADMASNHAASSAAVVALFHGTRFAGAFVLFSGTVGGFDTDSIHALNALAAVLQQSFAALEGAPDRAHDDQAN